MLLLGYVYAVLTARSRQVRRPLRHWWLTPLATFALSLALLCSYNYVAFENVLGPYDRTALSFGIREVGMIFLGLHSDQSQGMFMQQPFLLLGLIGIVPLVKESWRVALLLGALYFSVLLPNAMHPNWYGGFSFAGRYWWPVVFLWTFPASYAIRLLLRHSRAVVLLLCASSVLLQALLVRTWLRSAAYV
jgi:hypothetical protein